ncbi:MAG: c-type cytochrome [Betaproteobacteria bacterium]|nr:c-type cytochrome [Betaproteobacteria bacterium]
MKRFHLLVAVSIGLMLNAATVSAADPVSPARNQSAATDNTAKLKQLIKKQCSGCHGEDGNSLKPTIPKLSGQHADYLYKQLRNFKAADGKPMGPNNPMYPTPSDLVYVAAPEGKLPERTNPIYFLAMNGMVKDLTDADMKELALYFSQQKRKTDSAIKNTEAIEAAQRLYRGGDAARGIPTCAGCHGPDGAGLPAQFPRLSGQYAEYTATQLKNFRAGDRTNDPNSMMRDIAYRLKEDEIKALSEYIATLH